MIENVGQLLVQAIDAPSGLARGVLGGEPAQAITRTFGATSPIFVDVITLQRLAQPGCRRLRLSLWQEGVRLSPSSTPRRQSVDFELNYCRDGSAPQASPKHAR